jgi:5'-nucleotidase
VQLEEKDTDTSAFQNNFITITPLKFDWTDYEVLADIKGWELTLDGGQ